MIKKYSIFIVTIANILLCFAIYLNDFYQLEDFFIFGTPSIALCCLVLGFKKGNLEFRKLTLTLNILFLVLYAVFTTYVILLGMAIRAYPY